MKQNHFDFLIIGAGIIGISIALELRKKYSQSKICIIDKESDVAFHSSGRNSGVLHAGFYYTSDSLKAQFTKLGNSYLKDYCQKRKIKILHCGKLVVTKDEADLLSLDELFKRAKLNNVEFHDISVAEAKKIEPRVKTFQRAGWSPQTSVVNPYEVMESLLNDCLKNGIEVHFQTAYLKKLNKFQILTNKGVFESGKIINAAGLYADKIAKDFGYSKDYRILPFKGLYLYSTEPTHSFRTHIYPVPNLKNPFLGVHHTMTVDGHSKIGPTAIPAFWREQYNGFSRFKLPEAMQILSDEIQLLYNGGFDFRSLAIEEMKKYQRSYLVRESSLLASNVEVKNYPKWGKPGIRAQLLNIHTKKLEMDFKIEGGDESLHILNAVSPAFTCSQPFAEYICKNI